MKKTFIKIGACLLAMFMVVSSVIPAEAATNDYSYTYVYDYWGDVQECPDFYSVSATLAPSDLGLDSSMKFPTGLYAYGDSLYVMDSGNNRILEFEYKDFNLTLKNIITSIKGNTSVKELANPTDMAISEDGNIFICDQGNSRIVKVDSNYNYILEFGLPNDETLDQELQFRPSKLIVDTAERVYCCATGINKGLVKYEADGTFSGFVGAIPVSFDYLDYIWKKLSSQEQLSQMATFSPTEYNNLYVDSKGFIYTVKTENEETELKSESINPVRKLNLLGGDILVRNGDYPIYGDLYMGTGGGISGPSKFSDITVFDNDIYICCDSNRGRLFAYNDQGQMLFALGGNGQRDGFFRKAISVDHIGYTLFVLDYFAGAITIFNPTEFGTAVFNAIDLFDDGKYTESGESWEHVLKLDGNYDLAYIGIGRSLLRQKRYHEAMEYFELKYDRKNYSKAYKQYRKEWVEDHIFVIVAVLIVLFAVPGAINKVKSIKYEIATADIFKV